jgi:hypothetical protein
LDPETLHNEIQRLFDASKNLEDPAFKDFVHALCRLSAEMVGMQLDGGAMMVESESVEDVGSTIGLSPRTEPSHRRRVSGIHIPRTLVSPGINFLINHMTDSHWMCIAIRRFRH